MSSPFSAFLVSILCASSLLLSSCEHQKPAAATTPAAAAAPAALKARYECPMGCAGSQSDKPGKCPTCEMELVKKS